MFFVFVLLYLHIVVNLETIVVVMLLYELNIVTKKRQAPQGSSPS